MKIEKILSGISYKNPYNQPIDHIDILGITDDSREVQDGYMFIAVNGRKSMEHQYIDEAIQNGASVIVGRASYTLGEDCLFICGTVKVGFRNLAEKFL